MMSLRQQKRHNAMRLTQRTALGLFIERGFEAVTVEEVASNVEMAASTLYRHFATKEAIVLWDEHDVTLDDALEYELGRQTPLAAMRQVFVNELGSRYDDDLDFQLRRVQYIYATEQIHGAAIEADIADTAALAAGLTHFLSPKQKPNASLLAGAAMLALDTAFERWQRTDGAKPLGVLIGAAFDTLDNLGSIR